MRLLKWSECGVKGVVLDEEKMEGIGGARIRVMSRNMTTTTTNSGHFHRILLPGRYYLTVSYLLLFTYRGAGTINQAVGIYKKSVIGIRS